MTRTLITAALAAAALLAAPAAASAQAHDHAAMKGHDHAGQPAASAKAPSKAGAADVVVKVNGLVCDFCARSLEKTFMGTRKVARVAVDLNTKEVRLAFVPGQSLDDATVRKLVTSAGYAVVAVQRAPA